MDISVCFVVFGVTVLTAILLLGLAIRALRPPGLLVLDDATIDGKPGQKAIVFNSLEDLLRLAEAVEQAERGPKRPLLYMFQHVTLREAAFENHPELMRDLAGDGRSSWPLLHMWSKARIRCEEADLLPEGSGDTEGAFEEDSKLFDAVAIRPVKRGGYTAHVVTMPVPEGSPDAYLAAIVHKDDEAHEYMRGSPSTRYFTLERTDTPDRPLLCEWRRDGSRENYGEGPAPQVEPFADAVFERVGVGASGRAGPSAAPDGGAR